MTFIGRASWSLIVIPIFITNISHYCLYRLYPQFKNTQEVAIKEDAGRPAIITEAMEEEIVKYAKLLPMGGGTSIGQFLQQVTLTHDTLYPLNKGKFAIADSTLEAYFAKILPESAATYSSQNQARINAALNGCTSITHAVMMQAVTAGVDPALLFNMDRTTHYLNKDVKVLLRFLRGQKHKSNLYSQGASARKSKGGGGITIL